MAKIIIMSFFLPISLRNAYTVGAQVSTDSLTLWTQYLTESINVISDKYIHYRSKDDRLLFPTEASTVSGDLCIDRKSPFPAQPASEVGQVLIAGTK